jgi:hypothetical protein
MEQPETETLTEAAGMLAALRDAVGQAMVGQAPSSSRR